MSELLARLGAGGEEVAQGGFTIDPDKAREKLRQYQLADPKRYVLLLVEAAVSAGATRLEFEIDADDLHLRFDGPVFTYAQLENIYGSLFAADDLSGEALEAKDLARLRGLQQLAFALNSAMALNPRVVRVVSVHAEGPEAGSGTVLSLHPTEPDEVRALTGEVAGEATGEAAGAGLHNWIHVKDRFRPGLVVNFIRSLRGTLEEVELLRASCRWSRVPIVVNGEQVSREIGHDGPAWQGAEVRELEGEPGELIGQATIGRRDRDGELVPTWIFLVSNGVFIESRRLTRSVPGFEAIVDSPRFGKDVSQTKLLHDASYDAVIGAIRAAQDQLVGRLAERAASDDAPAWIMDTLRAWLGHRDPRSLAAALGEDPVFAAVAEVPLWPVVGGADDICTREIIESSGPVRFTAQAFTFAPVDVPFVIHSASEDVAELLGALFERRSQDYSAALEREWERQQHRLEFMSRRHLPELGSGHYVLREPISAEREVDGRAIVIRGELGLRAFGHCDSWVRLLSEGCLLQEVALDGPLPGLCAVVHTTLEANHSYDEAKATPALAAALVAMLEALERAMGRLAEHLREAQAQGQAQAELLELLRVYIRRVRRHDYARSVLMQFGFSVKQTKRALGRSPVELQPSWGLDDPDQPLHPLAEVPLYGQSSGRRASIAELAARRARGERLAWLEPGPGPLPELAVEVLLLGQADRELLRAVLGGDTLAPFAGRLEQIRRFDAFMERPESPHELGHATLVEVAFEAEGPAMRGELGLREYAGEDIASGSTPIRVLYHRRELCELELELPLPGLCAWVESEGFEVDAKLEGLQRASELRRPLLDALADLIAKQVDRIAARPARGRRCEWWVLTMVANIVFGAGRLAEAFTLLCGARGIDGALAELEGLLELLERYPVADLDRALGSLRGRGTLPTHEAARERLGRPTRKQQAAELDLLALRRGLARSLAKLLELPMFHRFELAHGGQARARSVSLAALFTRAGAGEPTNWVGDDFHLELAPKVELEILSLDPIEARLVEALLGTDALEYVGDWLLGRARFERRRKISEIRVARGATLALLELDQDGVRGELGISAADPKDAQRSKIRVFSEGREITVVDLRAQPMALLGALELDGLELDADHDELSAGDLARVRELVQAREQELIHALCDRFDALKAADRARAAALVRHLLVGWPPGSGGYEARSKKRRALFRRLAELPVFAGARKPWSAVELAEARERGRVATLEYRRPKLELPDTPVVVLDADDVGGALRALFGELRDLERELQRKRELDKRKRKAPAMAEGPPGDALASAAVTSEGLAGWLWVSDRVDEVMFGADGRAADKQVISDVCWCAGVISGVGLEIARDWSRVKLSRAQSRLLERQAVELWDELADEFERCSVAEAPTDDDERRRFARIRDGLHGLFMRLHDRYGRDRKSKRKRKRKRGNRYEKLYARLYDLALLELSTGRWISAEVGERERPIELAALGLWTGPSAEELAHQRAVERRDAERAREWQLERERERERERRRVEAEARRAEAERRRAGDALARRAAAKQRAAKQAERPEPRERPEPKERPKQPKGREVIAPLPTPEELLLEALREELRLVRAKNAGLVSNRHLESLTLGEAVRRGPLFRHADGITQIDAGHVLFRAVLEGYVGDPGLLTLLASSAYTYLNLIHVEIEDQHEAEFLELHAAHAATRL